MRRIKNILYIFMFLNILSFLNINETISQTITVGQYLPAKDTMKVFIVFAQLSGDSWDTGFPPWQVNSLPVWADSLVAPTAQSISTRYFLSDYFKTMSNSTYFVIGNYYPSLVITPQSESYYNSNGRFAEANQDILEQIDPYVDFSQYDKWSFNAEYNHTKPANGDGKVDMVVIIYRHVGNKNSFSNENGNASGIAALGLNNYDYLTDGSKIIRFAEPVNGSSGITDFSGIDQGPDGIFPHIPVLAHEFGHHILGPHIGDGYGLMPSPATFSPTMNAVERQKLGYMTITEITSSCNGRTLTDFLTSGTPTAYKVAIPNSSHYYLIENHQKISKYDGVGGWDMHRYPDQTGKGLYIFRVTNADGTSLVECADGRWNWDFCWSDNPWGGADIQICKQLTPNLTFGSGRNEMEVVKLFKKEICPVEITDWSNEVAGDNEDAFNIGYNQVFSPYSNPQTINSTNIGIELAGQNGSSMSINFYIGNAVNAPPSKPQYAQVSFNSSWSPVITWYANEAGEGISGYNIYRAVVYPGSGVSYTKLNSSVVTGTTYTDNTPISSGVATGNHVNYYYCVTAVDNQSLESVKSDPAIIYMGKTLNGTVSSNTTYNTKVLINGNVTVNSGVTLTFNADTVIKVASGTSITSNGTLNIAGASDNRIKIISEITSNTWSGIVLNGSGASGSSISYCNIRNVLTYGGAVIYAQNVPANGTYYTPSIFYNDISYNVNYGTDAVYFNNSNGYISRNKFESNGGAGVFCYNYASPNLFKPGYYHSCSQGNNTIIGNNYGVYASTYSNPYLGSSSQQANSYNRIYGNTTADVYATSYCSISAQYCYWGTSHKYQIINSSNLDTLPFASCDPGAAFKISSTPSGSAPIVTSAISNSLTGLSDLVKQAKEYQLSKKYKEAIDIYKSIITNNANSKECLISISGILSIFRDNNDPEILTYLESLTKLKGEIEAVSKMALANGYACSGKNDKALSALKEITEKFSNTEYEKHAAIQSALLYYFDRKDKTNAENILKNIEAKLKNAKDDKDLAMAKWLTRGNGQVFGKTSESNTAIAEAIENEEKEAQKENVQNYLFDNYPNPFNPSTDISYSVAKDCHVALKVYDMLGREVKTLVDQYQAAGKYSINFNAGNLSSGIYYYKIDAGTFTARKKMNFTK